MKLDFFEHEQRDLGVQGEKRCQGYEMVVKINETVQELLSAPELPIKRQISDLYLKLGGECEDVALVLFTLV